jgi:hypothetical protein
MEGVMINPFNVADPAELEATDIDTIRKVAARLRSIGSEWSARIIEVDAGIGRFEPGEEDDYRVRNIESLRRYADLLESNPDLPIGFIPVLRHQVYGYETDSVADRMREIRRMYGGRFDKSWDDNPIFPEFFLKGKFGEFDVVISTQRENVCERVVTSTIEEVVREPDPDLVATIPMVERTIVKEIVDWVCPEDLT